LQDYGLESVGENSKGQDIFRYVVTTGDVKNPKRMMGGIVGGFNRWDDNNGNKYPAVKKGNIKAYDGTPVDKRGLIRKQKIYVAVGRR